MSEFSGFLQYILFTGIGRVSVSGLYREDWGEIVGQVWKKIEEKPNI